MASRTQGVSVVGVYFGQSTLTVACGPVDEDDGTLRRIDVAVNAQGVRYTPTCVSRVGDARDDSQWQVGEPARSRMHVAPTTTFDRVLAAAWATERSSEPDPGIAVRVGVLLREAGADAVRASNRRVASMLGIAVAVASPPVALSALETALSQIATDGASPSLPRHVLMPTPIAALAGLPAVPTDAKTVLVLRVGATSVSAALLGLSDHTAPAAASSEVPHQLWTRTMAAASSLPAHTARVTAADGTERTVRLLGAGHHDGGGAAATYANVVDSALEQLSEELRDSLRPRTRMRWLRMVEEACTLVSKGAAMEALELETAGEVAALTITDSVLRHCAGPTLAAVEAVVRDALQVAAAGAGDVQYLLCHGGAARMPGVLTTVARVCPEAQQLVSEEAPDGNEVVSFGAAKLAHLHAAENVGIAVVPTRGRLPVPYIYQTVQLGLAVVLSGGSIHECGAFVVDPSITFPSARCGIAVVAAEGDTEVLLQFAIVRENGCVVCDLAHVTVPVPDSSRQFRIAAVLDVEGIVASPAEGGTTADAAVATAHIDILSTATKTLWRATKSGLLPNEPPIRPPSVDEDAAV